jgi:hypothetical protein
MVLYRTLQSLSMHLIWNWFLNQPLWCVHWLFFFFASEWLRQRSAPLALLRPRLRLPGVDLPDLDVAVVLLRALVLLGPRPLLPQQLPLLELLVRLLLAELFRHWGGAEEKTAERTFLGESEHVTVYTLWQRFIRRPI